MRSTAGLVVAGAVLVSASPAAAEPLRVRAKVTPANLIEGEPVTVDGRVRDAGRHAEALIQDRRPGRWHTIGRVSLRAGRFALSFVPKLTGPGVVRVIVKGPEGKGKTFAVYTSFRRTEATWYGPGFFGQSTACGQLYSDALIGVAHRTLPCGTPVSFLYAGTVLTVPVVDRGPYGTADWDLTAATAQILGFSGRQTVGVLFATEKPGE